MEIRNFATDEYCYPSTGERDLQLRIKIFKSYLLYNLKMVEYESKIHICVSVSAFGV